MGWAGEREESMVHSKGRGIGRTPSRPEDEGCVWSEAVENSGRV